MQVADAVPLVDLEVAVVVPVVDAVAHVLAEGGQGRGELQDVVAVAQIAEVQVELEGVFDVHAGQADLLRQLQETGSLASAFFVCLLSLMAAIPADLPACPRLGWRWRCDACVPSWGSR